MGQRWPPSTLKGLEAGRSTFRSPLCSGAARHCSSPSISDGSAGLLSGSNGLAERLLGLRIAVTTPFEAEAPEMITAEELTARFGDVDAKDIERVRRLKLLVPLGDGRFEIPSPALMHAAEEVVELGIPLHAALVLVERVSRDCESISRAFAKLFLKELWDPFEQAGQPDERWDEVIEAVGALRPLASEALLAVFKQRMTTQLEGAFGKDVTDGLCEIERF